MHPASRLLGVSYSHHPPPLGWTEFDAAFSAKRASVGVPGFLNSCYANEKHKIRGQGEQFVLISPADAAKRNIREGDPVRVYNDRGDFEGVAKVTDDVNPGIVVATLGYWRSLNRSDGSVNSISSDAHCGLGRAPTFSDNLVEVSRVN